MRDKFTVSLECDVRRVIEVGKREIDTELTEDQAREVLELMEESDADEDFDNYVQQKIEDYLDQGADD